MLAAAVGGAVIARADDLGAQCRAGFRAGSRSARLNKGDKALTVDRPAQAGAIDGFRIANKSSKALV